MRKIKVVLELEVSENFQTDNLQAICKGNTTILLSQKGKIEKSKVIRTYSKEIKAIYWSTNDFESRAEERWEHHRGDYVDATKWQDVYDESNFQLALERMIHKHDANYGIGWETIDYYLDDICLR